MDASDFIAIGAGAVALLALAHSIYTSRQERRERRRAHLLARTDGVIGRGSAGEDLRPIAVTNAGPFVARKIRLRVVDKEGRDLAPEVKVVADLAPGQSASAHVPVRAEWGEGEFQVRVRWEDGAGEQDEELAFLHSHIEI